MGAWMTLTGLADAKKAVIKKLVLKKNERCPGLEAQLYLITKLEGRQATLLDQLQVVARILEEAAGRLEQGRAINTQGEVQGRGSAIDTLCAEVGALYEALGQIRTLAE